MCHAAYIDYGKEPLYLNVNENRTKLYKDAFSDIALNVSKSNLLVGTRMYVPRNMNGTMIIGCLRQSLYPECSTDIIGIT